MDADNLIRMANRIGDFFEAMPDADEAIEGVATHIRKFWDPRMRRQLVDAIDAGQPGVHDIVSIAVERFRTRLV
jgi:formate dehydrogenase subunit delta